jgi:hypothetical protein
LLLNDGAGQFAKNTSRLPAQIMSIANDQYPGSQLADVDGDSRLDLVLACYARPGAYSPLRILFGSASGNFAERAGYVIPSVPFSTNSICLDFVALDVNGDGRTDLVSLATQDVPYYVGAAVRILIAGANGLTDETATRMTTAVRVTGPWIDNLTTADFNGDGRVDLHANMVLALGGGNPPAVDFIWINEGNGVYRAGSTSLLSEFPFIAGTIDIDADGRDDLVRLFSDPNGALGYQTYLSRP